MGLEPTALEILDGGLPQPGSFAAKTKNVARMIGDADGRPLKSEALLARLVDLPGDAEDVAADLPRAQMTAGFTSVMSLSTDCP